MAVDCFLNLGKKNRDRQRSDILRSLSLSLQAESGYGKARAVLFRRPSIRNVLCPLNMFACMGSTCGVLKSFESFLMLSIDG